MHVLSGLALDLFTIGWLFTLMVTLIYILVEHQGLEHLNFLLFCQVCRLRSLVGCLNIEASLYEQLFEVVEYLGPVSTHKLLFLTFQLVFRHCVARWHRQQFDVDWSQLLDRHEATVLHR